VSEVVLLGRAACRRLGACADRPPEKPGNVGWASPAGDPSVLPRAKLLARTREPVPAQVP
jgi:hypothetical protein